jgi:hypothetical protein
MAGKTYFFSESGLRQYHKATAHHPALQKLHKLYVDYARKQGGLTLDVWRTMRGPMFGEPQRMDVEAAAETLGVPVSEVLRVRAETYSALGPSLRKLQPDLRHVSRALREYAKKHPQS